MFNPTKFKEVIVALYYRFRFLAEKEALESAAYGPLKLTTDYPLQAFKALLNYLKKDTSTDQDTFDSMVKTYGEVSETESSTYVSFVGACESIISEYEKNSDEDPKNAYALRDKIFREAEKIGFTIRGVNESGDLSRQAMAACLPPAAAVLEGGVTFSTGRLDPGFVMAYLNKDEGSSEFQLVRDDEGLVGVLKPPRDALHVSVVNPNYAFPDRGGEQTLLGLIVNHLKSKLPSGELFMALNTPLGESFKDCLSEVSQKKYLNLLKSLKNLGDHESQVKTRDEKKWVLELKFQVKNQFDDIGEDESLSDGLKLFFRIKRTLTLGSFYSNFFRNTKLFPEDGDFPGLSMPSLSDWCDYLPDIKSSILGFIKDKTDKFNAQVKNTAFSLQFADPKLSPVSSLESAFLMCMPLKIDDEAALEADPFYRFRVFLGVNPLSVETYPALHCTLGTVVPVLGVDLEKAAEVFNATLARNAAEAAEMVGLDAVTSKNPSSSETSGGGGGVSKAKTDNAPLVAGHSSGLFGADSSPAALASTQPDGQVPNYPHS